MNEYVIVRDLGQGSSAEVKLCQLVMPTQPQACRGDDIDDRDGSEGGGRDGAGEGRRRHFVASGDGDIREEGQELRVEGEEEEEGGGGEGAHGDLYVSEQETVIAWAWLVVEGIQGTTSPRARMGTRDMYSAAVRRRRTFHFLVDSQRQLIAFAD